MRATWLAASCATVMWLMGCDSRPPKNQSTVRPTPSKESVSQRFVPKDDWPRTDDQVKELLAKADKRGGHLSDEDVAKLEFAAGQDALLAYFALYLHHSMDGDPSQQDRWFLEGAKRGEPNLLVAVANEQRTKAEDASPSSRADLLLRARQNYRTVLRRQKSLTVTEPFMVREEISEIDTLLNKIDKVQ